MNWKVLGAGFLVVAPLVVVLASGFGRDPKALPNVMEGREAPAFSLSDMDGQAVSLAGLRGRPVVINFWASWC
ncbi:TlpA family protein disulfide reductase, partial [Myxococcota bacterium]|nr:TlpA family protein disulfide reductase [Myxococcota bacterium]